MVLITGGHMGIRSFIRGIREELFPETLMNKLEELEELDKKLESLKVSKETVVFKKAVENDFYKAVINYCTTKEEKENKNV